MSDPDPVQARLQLEAEEEKVAALGCRLGNLAAVLEQVGEEEAAKLTSRAETSLYDAYDFLHEALDEFPPI